MMSEVQSQDTTLFGSIPQYWMRGLPYLVIATACIIVRIPFLSVPMIVDEGSYAYVAKFAGEGHQLYRDIPFDRPQGLFLIYKVAFLLIGESPEDIRLFAAIWTAAAGMVLFRFLREAHSEKAAWFGALGFALFSATASIEGYSANGETFMSLPLFASALFAWRRQFGWAGLLAGAAAFLKPSGVSGLFLACTWALLHPNERRGALRAIIAFSVWPLLSMAHGALIDWQAYWTTMVTERISNVFIVSVESAQQLNAFRRHLRITFPGWAVPFACAAIAAFRSEKHIRNFGLIFILSNLAGMSLGARWDEYYFIHLVGSLCFLGGIGAASLRHPRKDWAAIGACMLAVLVAAEGEVPYWLMSPVEYSTEFYSRDAYPRGEEVARFVRENTQPEDPIYVAFSSAHLYHLANRRAAPPILFSEYLRWSEEKSERVMQSIRSRTPAAIIVTQPVPGPYLDKDLFWAALTDGYELAYRSRLITVHLRKNGGEASPTD